MRVLRHSLGIAAMTLWAATAGASPDVLTTWHPSCLDGYKKIVSAMDPKLIPDTMTDVFKTDSQQKAYLEGVPTVPWLSIYNRDLKPIYHAVGYNSRSDELWKLVVEQNQPTEFAPALYEIEPYTSVRAVELPQADFTFVEYAAKWCTQCKLQAQALKTFKTVHAGLSITHVQIEADTAKMQQKKHKNKACPAEL